MSGSKQRLQQELDAERAKNERLWHIITTPTESLMQDHARLIEVLERERKSREEAVAETDAYKRRAVEILREAQQAVDLLRILARTRIGPNGMGECVIEPARLGARFKQEYDAWLATHGGLPPERPGARRPRARTATLRPGTPSTPVPAEGGRGAPPGAFDTPPGV